MIPHVNNQAIARPPTCALIYEFPNAIRYDCSHRAPHSTSSVQNLRFTGICTLSHMCRQPGPQTSSHTWASTCECTRPRTRAPTRTPTSLYTRLFTLSVTCIRIKPLCCHSPAPSNRMDHTLPHARPNANTCANACSVTHAQTATPSATSRQARAACPPARPSTRTDSPSW